jgi:glutamyl-tRNA synthetase
MQKSGMITGRVNPVVSDEDSGFVSDSAKSLPPEPWDSTTWKTWTDALKLTTDRKGKQLFMPLRLALTGLDHGPELAALLPLMGRQKIMDRLA